MAQVILMPRLSPTMEEGVLAKWTKKEGDAISPGDVIAEVETDKANMDFPLEDEGVLLKLLVKEGETVKLGAPVAVLGQAGEDPAEAMKSIPAAPSAPGAAAAPAQKAAPAQPAGPSPTPALIVAPTPAPTGNGHLKASPLARKIADERGIDLHAVAGSGPGGRIVKRDVEAAQAAPQLRAAAPIVTLEDRLIPASQMRKTIARRLVEAKREIPHIYLTAEATVDALFELRTQVNDLGLGPRRQDGGAEGPVSVKISVNDLVVKAMAMALRRVPDANSSWTDQGILRHGRVDVGVAVSLPEGIITPVIRGADQKPITTLAAEVKSLAERARAKKLKPEEFSGGTATVTNLGMYGVKQFEAIINPPEAVILAVGAVEKRPIVIEKNGRDEVAIARRMSITLSCDHRVVDGVLGAQLLAEIVRLLEKPLGMLL